MPAAWPTGLELNLTAVLIRSQWLEAYPCVVGVRACYWSKNCAGLLTQSWNILKYSECWLFLLLPWRITLSVLNWSQRVHRAPVTYMIWVATPPWHFCLWRPTLNLLWLFPNRLLKILICVSQWSLTIMNRFELLLTMVNVFSTTTAVVNFPQTWDGITQNRPRHWDPLNSGAWGWASLGGFIFHILWWLFSWGRWFQCCPWTVSQVLLGDDQWWIIYHVGFHLSGTRFWGWSFDITSLQSYIAQFPMFTDQCFLWAPTLAWHEPRAQIICQGRDDCIHFWPLDWRGYSWRSDFSAIWAYIHEEDLTNVWSYDHFCWGKQPFGGASSYIIIRDQHIPTAYHWDDCLKGQYAMVLFHHQGSLTK